MRIGLQEMKKRRIVIASVLKPVDDTRAFEKMAASLANKNQQVFLIGQPSQNQETNNDSIHFLPLKKFGRLSLERWLAPIKITQKIHKVKPEILVVNTHELLIVAVLNRILFGTRIIYDVQENYWRNILLTNAFPSLLRPLIAAWVRLKEKVTSPLFQGYLLAEKGYEKEIGFVGNKYSVIENKVRLPIGFSRQPNSEKVKLVFTGTLSESTGVFKAIDLAKKLHELEPKIELLIIGHCAKQNALFDIQKAIKNHLFISLKGGDELVPHAQILEAISTANFGIISYPISPHIENSTPTKLYEYLGCRLPILLQNHVPWKQLCERYDGAISLDFSVFDGKEILQSMTTKTFYSKIQADATELTWASEEVRFLEAIQKF